MDLRKWMLIMSLLVPVFSAGCGSSYTDENVREKVITQKDMEEMQEQQKKLAEFGIRSLAPPGALQPRPSQPGQ